MLGTGSTDVGVVSYGLASVQTAAKWHKWSAEHLQGPPPALEFSKSNSEQ